MILPILSCYQLELFHEIFLISDYFNTNLFIVIVHILYIV